MIARYFLFLSFIFLLSFLALFARLLGALIHSAAVAAVCSAQQGTGSSLALIPTRIAAVWLSVVLDRINSSLRTKKPRLRIIVRNLGKKSQAFGIYREETGVKKKADLGRCSYCSCGLCCFFFCLPTLMMNSIYIYIIIAPKIFGAMLHCLFRQLSVVRRWHRAKSNDNSHVCCLLISLRLSFRRRYTSLWLGSAMSREAFGR